MPDRGRPLGPEAADAGATTPAAIDDLAGLLAFLYRAPIGLVQAGLDGHIEMLNPMAAQMLLPLAVDNDVVNLFELHDVMDPPGFIVFINVGQK